MSTVETKKLLVGFDVKRLTAKSSDFLLPVVTNSEPKLYGLSSGKHFYYGMVVLTGKAVTVSDVFAKLVDSGARIKSIDETLGGINYYFDVLKTFKVGDVLRIVKDPSSCYGFRLEKTSFKPLVKKKGLP